MVAPRRSKVTLLKGFLTHSIFGSAHPNSIPFYPHHLKEFRLALTAAENEVDAEDSDDNPATPIVSTSVPPILARVFDLPTTVHTLTMDLIQSRSLALAFAPTEREFPFTLRSASFVHLGTITPALLRWILQPALDSRSLRSLKLWGNANCDHAAIVELVAIVGPELEEFLYKPPVRDPLLALDLVKSVFSLPTPYFVLTFSSFPPHVDFARNSSVSRLVLMALMIRSTTQSRAQVSRTFGSSD